MLEPNNKKLFSGIEKNRESGRCQDRTMAIPVNLMFCWDVSGKKDNRLFPGLDKNFLSF